MENKSQILPAEIILKTFIKKYVFNKTSAWCCGKISFGEKNIFF